jgi:beta-glucosidase
LNEAEIVADLGYGIGVFAPGVLDKMWPARHHTVLAHVKTYDLYKNEFKVAQKGVCGITMNTDWYEPATDSDGDKLAAQNQMDSQLGFWADPIYTDRKDYPDSVRAAAGNDLPQFTTEEKAMLGKYILRK